MDGCTDGWTTWKRNACSHGYHRHRGIKKGKGKEKEKQRVSDINWARKDWGTEKPSCQVGSKDEASIWNEERRAGKKLMVMDTCRGQRLVEGQRCKGKEGGKTKQDRANENRKRTSWLKGERKVLNEKTCKNQEVKECALIEKQRESHSDRIKMSEDSK